MGGNLLGIRIQRSQVVLAQSEQSPDMRILQQLSHLIEELVFGFQCQWIDGEDLFKLVKDQHDVWGRRAPARTARDILGKPHRRDLCRTLALLRETGLEAKIDALHEPVRCDETTLRRFQAYACGPPHVERFLQPRYQSGPDQRTLARPRG